MRPDVNKIFEEIEKAANRPKAEKVEVALEDLGAGLATKMLEDLEMWMPDAPDAAKWVLEEPLDKKPMKIPEMPLPTALEDMVGDLLAEGRRVRRGGRRRDLGLGRQPQPGRLGRLATARSARSRPRARRATTCRTTWRSRGRSGDGRRGKSSGQMVGDTAQGAAKAARRRPASTTSATSRASSSRKARSDPNGSTGGGKKAGSGRKGLQGGTPPDFVRDIGRLTEKQAGLRDKAEQVAKKLETAGVANRRLNESITLMKSAEQDLRDLRYEDAARKRRVVARPLEVGLHRQRPRHRRAAQPRPRPARRSSAPSCSRPPTRGIRRGTNRC